MLVSLSANSGSVCQLKIWRTALTIFLIFCMNVSYYKTKKRTGPFVREKSGSCTMCINSAHMHIGLFLDFSGSDLLDIAYDGSPKSLVQAKI